MLPTYNSAGAATNNSLATSVTVTKPAGATRGKAWIVVINTTNARTFTTPAGGWVPIGTHATQAAAFLKICTGSEGSTQAFAYTGGTSNVRSYTWVENDVDPTNPILVGGTWIVTASGASSLAAPAITLPAGLTGNDALISVAFLLSNTTVITKPASMVQDFQNNTTQTFAGAAEKALTSGTTGTRSWTWTGAQGGAATVFALRGIGQNEYVNQAVI